MIQRLVLIDDDQEDLEFIHDAIKSINPLAECQLFLEACEALMYLKANVLPEIVIIDLSMPKISGIECLEQIRDDPRFAGLFVVVYSSAMPPEEVINTIIRLGGVVIQKPSNLHDLNKVIAGLMNRS